MNNVNRKSDSPDPILAVCILKVNAHGFAGVRYLVQMVDGECIVMHSMEEVESLVKRERLLQMSSQELNALRNRNPHHQ